MNKSFFTTFLVLILSSCMETNKPLVIGHRGAMGHETENTLKSVQKAMDMGVDMIEIDVFKIKSGEIVVFHDDTVERLTDGEGDIESYTLSDLQQLTVEGGHTIPTLKEVLNLVNGKVLLNIELKGENTAADVNTIIGDYIKGGDWKLTDFIISSFNWDELRKMRKVNATIPIAVLTGKEPLDGIPVAKELDAEAINPSFKTLNLEVANKIREAGLKIYTWTVNEPNDINGMKRIAVDGIITNYPERVQ